MAGSHRTGELKVPTMAVAVRLALVGGQPAAVEMFLPDAPGRPRGQLLDDLAAQLAGDARFVPVRTASRVRLVAKHAIAWVAIARHASDERLLGAGASAPASEPGEVGAPVSEPDEVGAPDAVGPPREVGAVPPRGAPADIPEELTLFDHQHFVEVELGQGGKLIGTLLDSEPADHSRLGDHLNHTGRWLRLWTTEQHYLINVQQVVAVTELGEVW